MTPEQEMHLAYLLGKSDALIAAKYRAGQKEHGGDLWSVLDLRGFILEALKEAADQIVYLLCALDNLDNKENPGSKNLGF